MIAQVQGRVKTNFGSFLYTSRHTRKSLWPWQRKGFFVGYWADKLNCPTILTEIIGDYIVEEFNTPVPIVIATNHLPLEEINQAFEDAELEQSKEL